MKNNPLMYNCYSRVDNLKKLLHIKRLHCKPAKAGLIVDTIIKQMGQSCAKPSSAKVLSILIVGQLNCCQQYKA